MTANGTFLFLWFNIFVAAITARLSCAFAFDSTTRLRKLRASACVWLNECSVTEGFEKKMGKEIRIIKKEDQKKFEEYTFIADDNNNIELNKVGSKKDPISPSSLSSNNKKPKQYEFKLRNNPKKDMKSRNKSRLVGGHSIQSHSSVYE